MRKTIWRWWRFPSMTIWRRSGKSCMSLPVMQICMAGAASFSTVPTKAAPQEKREDSLAGMIWNNFLFYVDHETGAYLLGLSEAETKVTVSQYEGFAFASEAVEENASSYFYRLGNDLNLGHQAGAGSAWRQCVLSVEGGTSSYVQMSGTSMAAPFCVGFGCACEADAGGARPFGGGYSGFYPHDVNEYSRTRKPVREIPSRLSVK